MPGRRALMVVADRRGRAPKLAGRAALGTKAESAGRGRWLNILCVPENRAGDVSYNKVKS